MWMKETAHVPDAQLRLQYLSCVLHAPAKILLLNNTPILPTLHLHTHTHTSFPAASFGSKRVCQDVPGKVTERTRLQVQMGEQTWMASRGVKTPSPDQGCWTAVLPRSLTPSLAPSLLVLISRILTLAWQPCVFSYHKCIKWIYYDAY